MRLTGLIAVAIAAVVPATADRLFSPAELQSDLATLRALLEYNHPALHAWVDRATLDSYFESAFGAATREMDAVEFLTLVQPLVARVGCGHTRAYPPAGLAAATGRKSLPLTLLFARGECRIRQTYGLDEIAPPGSKVLAVNGMTAEALHDRWSESVPVDGLNRTRKTWLLNYNPPLGALAAIFGFPDEYEVTLLAPGESEPRTVSVAARKLGELQAIAPKLYPAQVPEVLNVRWIPERNAAVLSIRTFDLPTWGDVAGRLADVFATLEQQRPDMLIIDVRGNGGGAPETAAPLLQYLAREPFAYFARAVPVYAALMRLLMPQPNAFRNRVYVLADGGCFSTTGHFLSLIRYHRLADIVGEESGASFSCNDGHITATLPATGVVVTVARYTFETAVTGLPRGRGISPDYEVLPTAENILEERDAVLEFTLGLK